MIELFIGCSLFLNTVITEQSIDDYFLCNHLQDVKQWYGLTNKYFGNDTLFALAIMSCESDGYPDAININKDNSIDQGLFQFNSETEQWLEKDIYNKDLDMFNAETNIKTAAWLFKNDGRGKHWRASQSCWERYGS